MDAELDRILAADYLDGLAARPVSELRALRAECQGVETQLSYLRRMVQGHHDIVSGELARRQRGGEPGDLGDLVEQLPQILADRIHAPGPGRLPTSMAPGEVHGRLADRLEAIISRIPLESPADADGDALTAVAADLDTLESDVSQLRRALFDRIDTLQSEITHRYRDGQAQVDDLLTGG